MNALTAYGLRSRNVSRAYAPGLRLALLFLLMVLLTACNGQEPRKANPNQSENDFIRDENFDIKNYPSRDKALVTGMGCGGTRQEAESRGRDVARFNLRGVTGPGDYHIIYRVKKVLPHSTLICVEMEAEAKP